VPNARPSKGFDSFESLQAPDVTPKCRRRFRPGRHLLDQDWDAYMYIHVYIVGSVASNERDKTKETIRRLKKAVAGWGHHTIHRRISDEQLDLSTLAQG
jgi:hypothetical protein